MKTFRKLKKGFTIVELVIVIAVIAILAAVLVPTFANLIDKANKSADTQLVRNLNTVLIADSVTEGKHKTMQSALDAVNESGYDVAKIMNNKATDNTILWDSENDVFCYLNEGVVEYIPGSVSTQLEAGDYKLWAIYGSMADANKEGETYSVYLAESATDKTVEITARGFDAGKNTEITSVIYNGETSAKDIIIRTNSYDTAVSVNGKEDTVTHYGEAKEVDVIQVAMSSYHEKGTVVSNINLAYGNVEIESGASVSKVVIKALTYTDANGTEQTITPAQESVKVAVDSNAKLNLVAADSTTENVTIANIVSGSGAENVAKVEKNDSNVAYIGTTGYSIFSLSSAFTDVKDGETIVLMQDFDYYSVYTYLNVPTLNSTAKYTLDLGGHEIILGDNMIRITAGNVTIINGIIQGNTWPLFPKNCTLTLGNNLTVKQNGTTTKYSAVFTSGAQVIVDGAKIDAGIATGIFVGANSVLTVKNGDIYGGNAAISGNGNGDYNNTTISIEGGYIHGSSYSSAIYHPQIGVLNISGGIIEGGTAIYIKSGTLNVTGGTIKGTGAKGNYQFNGNGAYITGDAIVIDACEYPGGNPTAHVINGANITSVHADPITVYLYDRNDDEETPSANITTTLAHKIWMITLEGTTYTATCGNESYSYEKK